ncbi:hypothetical protein KEM52_004740, partial [Ascosphaera acerosa]
MSSTEENTVPTAADAAAAAEFTYAEVAQMKDKSRMYTVIHDKVYNMTQFVDEHPYV